MKVPKIPDVIEMRQCTAHQVPSPRILAGAWFALIWLHDAQAHVNPVALANQTPAAFVQAWVMEQFRVPWQTASMRERRVCSWQLSH